MNKNHVVDISGHLSKCFSTSMIDNTDYFIVMDDLNYRVLVEKSVPVSKIYFIGSESIGDPYQKDEIFFDNTFRKIKTSIDAIFI